jgi:hypothetical protein
VIIRFQEHGALFTEAHVDGTATAPFLVPAGLVRQSSGQDPSPRATGVYVIVDGRLSEEPRSVELRFRPILSRSIAVGLTHMMRTTLELTATSAERDGAHFEYSAIPVAYGYSASFDFRTSTMRPLFEYGYDCARAGRFWISSARAAGENADRGDSTNQNVQCPADDEFIGRFAVR